MPFLVIGRWQMAHINLTIQTLTIQKHLGYDNMQQVKWYSLHFNNWNRNKSHDSNYNFNRTKLKFSKCAKWCPKFLWIEFKMY